MKILKSIILATLIILVTNVSQAQSSDADQVKELIEKLFDAMRASDAESLSSCFHESAKMLTAMVDEQGNTRLAESTVSGFADAISKAEEGTLDERITGWDIKVDGPMAMAWTNYEFYRGDTFSHCGVNNFTLFKDNGSWKIIQIIDTRNRTGCK